MVQRILSFRYFLQIGLVVISTFELFACSPPQKSTITPSLQVATLSPIQSIVTPIDAEILITEKTPTPEITPTPASSSTPLPQSTSTPSPFSSYADLPAGQYVLYSDTAQGNGLYALSQDGSINQKLTGGEWPPLLQDGTLLLQYDISGQSILDLKQNTLYELPNNGCSYTSISPERNRLAMQCQEDYEIYMLDLTTGAKVRLTNATNPEEYYRAPLWSPDGKWIAFMNLTNGPHTPHGQYDSDDGLYLLDTTCLDEPDTCKAKTYGPYINNIWLWEPYSWSPDSHRIAFLYKNRSGPIQIFSLKNLAFEVLQGTTNFSNIDSLGWSPDGNWIAYSVDSKGDNQSFSTEIFLVGADGDANRLLFHSTGDIQIFSWLRVPFQVGDVLGITEAGSDLNLRDTPTLGGVIMTKLQLGDIIIILEDSVNADGYNWWRVKVEGQEIEGWVAENFEWYKLLEK